MGDGSVALMHTKGHTEGNHSIVAHTDQGLLVTSENGVSMDAYAPQHSNIKGLAKYAELTDAEVVMNGNTLEYGIDQYLSMIQEKTVAGPYPKDERFFNMALSSESAGYYLFPGTAPTVRMGELEFGTFTPKTTKAKKGVACGANLYRNWCCFRYRPCFMRAAADRQRQSSLCL
nr:hypothetical protein [Psychrobacter sp. PraFG1]UNK05328.1 hypothetical protein MN210_15880 [Psychrobacter sp. PraFG1]